MLRSKSFSESSVLSSADFMLKPVEMKKSLTIPGNIKVVKATNQVERTHFVLWALILFLFITVGRIQEIISGLAAIYPGKVFGILMILAYIFYSGEKNRITLRGFPELVCILGILLIGLLSIPFSVWPRNSLEFMIGFLIKDMAFFYIIATTLTRVNQLRKIVFGWIVAVDLLSIVALNIRTGISRISASTRYDPNDLAFLLLCVLPFVIFSFFKEKGIKKLFLFLSGGLILTTIIFTRSRGGFVGLLVVGAVILFKTFKKSKLLAVLILLGSIAVFSFVAPSGYWERMETIVEPGKDYNISDPAGRIEVWKRGFNLMIGNPLTGAGIGNFTTAEGQSHKDEGGKWSTAHNSFIQIGGELGIGGLILFILLIYYLFKRIRKIISKDPQIKTFKDSLEVSLIGYVTGGFFLSQAYSVILYLIVGLVIALYYIDKRSDLNHV